MSVDLSASPSDDPYPRSQETQAMLPHRRVIKRLRELIVHRTPNGEEIYLIFLAIIVGLLMGVVCALFRYLIDLSFQIFFAAPLLASHTDSIFPPFALPIIRALLPAIGGFLVGLLIYKILKLSGGHGVPSVMKAVATGHVNLHPSMAIKSASSIVTITSGGSCGPEGPIIEIGSVVGSVVGHEAQVSKERVGTLIGCGSAAGIAAIFNAPIGGVFLALELLMRDFAVRTIGPVVVAAVIASVTSEALLPNSPVFPSLPPEVMTTINSNFLQLTTFAVLGILCGLIGALLVYALFKTHDFFQTMKIPLWIKPAVGGLMVGIVGLAFPKMIGEGYEFVREDILMHYASGEGSLHLSAAILFLFFCLVKIFVTSLTLGSGGTGGSFAPAMVAGSMIGAGFGVLCNVIMPELSPAVPVFALVGLAGTVCSALNAPIAGIFIAYEVSGANYRLVLPLMITVAASAFVSSLLKQGSVYTLPLLRDGFDVEKAMGKATDPLADVTVRNMMNQNFTRVGPKDNLSRMIDAFSNSDDDAFAVVDPHDNLLGMVSTRDLRGVLTLAGVGEAIIAQDAADINPNTLYPNSPASEAMIIFGQTEVSGIPVLAKPGSKKIIGMVSRVDVLSAYREAAAE
jgi:chloride channel protein, CIC family